MLSSHFPGRKPPHAGLFHFRYQTHTLALNPPTSPPNKWRETASRRSSREKRAQLCSLTAATDVVEAAPEGVGSQGTEESA